MKKQLFLTILSLFNAGCFAASNNNNALTSYYVQLKTKDAKILKRNRSVAQQIPLINDILSNFSDEANQKPIPIDIEGKTLECIIGLLKLKQLAQSTHNYSLNNKEKRTPRHINIKSTLDCIKFIKKNIPKQKPREWFFKLVNAFSYLQIEGPIAQAIAAAAHKNGISFQDAPALNQLTQEQCKAVCKTFCLERNKVYNTCCHELSIQDLIDNNKCPSAEDTLVLDLSHRCLTSLHGLKNINGIKNFGGDVGGIDLRGNRLRKIDSKDLEPIKWRGMELHIDSSNNFLTSFALQKIEPASKENIHEGEIFDVFNYIYLRNNYLSSIPSSLMQLYNKKKIIEKAYTKQRKADENDSDSEDGGAELYWDHEDALEAYLSRNYIAKYPKHLNNKTNFANIYIERQKQSTASNLKRLAQLCIDYHNIDYRKLPIILTKNILIKQILRHVDKKCPKGVSKTDQALSTITIDETPKWKLLNHATHAAWRKGKVYKLQDNEVETYKVLPEAFKNQNFFIVPTETEILFNQLMHDPQYNELDQALGINKKTFNASSSSSAERAQNNQQKRGLKRKKSTSASEKNIALALNIQKNKKLRPTTHRSLRTRTRLDKRIDTFTDLITCGLSQNNNNFDAQKLLSTHTEIKDINKSKAKALIASDEFNQFFNQLIKDRKQQILESLRSLWSNNPDQINAFNKTFKKSN